MVKRAVLVASGMLLVACSSLRQPIPVRSFLPETTAEEAVPVVMQVLEANGYRVISVERDAGHVVGLYQGPGITNRMTVSVYDDEGGASVRITPESSQGAERAESAARSLEREIRSRAGDGA